MKPEKNKEAQKRRTQTSDEKLRKARTVTYSSKIDPLRQGQGLDAIDQKPKHGSSKTEVTLDAVMLEAEGKRGNQEPKPKQKLPKQSFSLSQVQLSQNDALSKPCAQQVFSKKNQTSLPLVRSLLSKFSSLLAHAHIKATKT